MDLESIIDTITDKVEMVKAKNKLGINIMKSH